jgi:hypothetical protein
MLAQESYKRTAAIEKPRQDSRERPAETKLLEGRARTEQPQHYKEMT